MNLDPWHLQNFLGILLCVLIIWRLKYPTIYRCIWLYFLLYSVLVTFHTPIGDFSPISLALKWGAAKIAFTLLAIPFVFQYAKESTIKIVNKLILFILTVDAVWLCFGGDGIFIGNTHDAVVLAIFLPHLFASNKWFMKLAIVPFIATIFITHATAAVIIMMFEALVYAAFFIRQKWITATLSIVWALFLARTLQTDQTFRGERWVHWVKYLDFWGANASSLLGFGPGSTEWLSWAYKLHEPYQMWMHSDWLQIVFETGLIGGFLALLFWGVTFYRFRNSWGWTASWLGLGIGMFVYSPLQFFVVQWMIGVGLRDEEKEWDKKTMA